jgi:hypothetical protein
MAPKTRKPKKSEVFTLKDAHDYIYSRNHATSSKDLWFNCIVTITHYNETADGTPITTLTKAELYEKYENINIFPSITNTEKTIDIVMNKIKNSIDGTDISIETKKTYITAVQRLTDPGGLKLSKDAHEEYKKQFEEIVKITTELRNKNTPKGGNKKHPDFDWITAITEYNQFLNEAVFTNTKNGRKNLRAACAVGFYTLMHPRRVQDYSSLQWYSNKPDNLEDKNIVYCQGEGDNEKLFISIDKFKTRHRTTGRTNKKKEVLPRFEKELNPRLASLIKDHIQKDKVPDMAKRTVAQKRDDTQFYIFAKDDKHTDYYDDNSFSKLLTGYFKYVFKRAGLSVNTFRHAYNTFIYKNANSFTDAHMKEISLSVGDKPRELPSNARYRDVDPKLADLEKTIIEEMLIDDDYAKKLMEGNAEEGGSIQGDVAKDDGEQEVVSGEARQVPQNDNVGAYAGVVDEDLNVLYTRLGEAHMQVKLLEGLIAKKLNF